MILYKESLGHIQSSPRCFSLLCAQEAILTHSTSWYLVPCSCAAFPFVSIPYRKPALGQKPHYLQFPQLPNEGLPEADHPVAPMPSLWLAILGSSSLRDRLSPEKRQESLTGVSPKQLSTHQSEPFKSLLRDPLPAQNPLVTLDKDDAPLRGPPRILPSPSSRLYLLDPSCTLVLLSRIFLELSVFCSLTTKYFFIYFCGDNTFTWIIN